ncbi:hypothetical protein NUW58_g6338 [Xylaria curta]|uniref:Uncharacterized protein n=1 Tax=Xylaria curta TaxID=42375 RepID=A0ACC1NUX4_9PEZI|nr:hypothetical protein NUW58_g6338 [Xylaria curta]
MTLVQNTFSLVPDVSIANSNRHGKADDTYAHLTRPPMTTKQVKKAYRTSNKAPKLSKAQQRRLELFEQDRIRKGFEKEKNQARARAVRDKKREREERERAIKKKKGLPLVDVRPSQDTIARFVRVKPKNHPPDGASPLRNSEEECWDHNQIHRFDNSEKNLRPPENISDLAPTDNSHGPSDRSSILDYAIPPNKKRRVDDQIFFPVVDEVASPSPYPSLMGSITSNYAQRAPSPIAEQDRLNVHDSFSTVDLSEEDPPDDTLSEAKCVYCSSNALQEKVFWPQQCRGASSEFPVPESPEYHLPSANNPSIMLLCVECAARPTQPLPLPQPNPPPKPVIEIEKTPHSNAILEQSKQSLTSHSSAILTPSRMQESELNAPSSPPPRHPQSPAAISSASAKSKLDEQVPASHPKRPRFLNPSLPPADTPARRPRHSQVAKPNTQENELPSSTQLFIHSHLDDLLPSPSQEAREIFEEPQLEQTGSSGEAEFMGTPHNRCSETSLYTTGIPTMPRNCSMAPTPSIDFRGSRHSQKIVDYSEPPKAAARPPVQLINQNAPSAFEIPFFSTQDLLLSSQDLKDIEDKPPPHIKTNTTPLSANVCISPQTTVQSSLKPLLTSTCRQQRGKAPAPDGKHTRN